MATHGQVRVPVQAILAGAGIPKPQLEAVIAVVMERQRQERLVQYGAIPFSCSDPLVDDSRKLAVLIEEVGEVAKEINEFAIADNTDEATPSTPVRQLLEIRRRQRDELIHTAASAIAWAEAINAELSEFGEFTNEEEKSDAA